MSPPGEAVATTVAELGCPDVPTYVFTDAAEGSEDPFEARVLGDGSGLTVFVDSAGSYPTVGSRVYAWRLGPAPEAPSVREVVWLRLAGDGVDGAVLSVDTFWDAETVVDECRRSVTADVRGTRVGSGPAEGTALEFWWEVGAAEDMADTMATGMDFRVLADVSMQ